MKGGQESGPLTAKLLILKADELIRVLEKAGFRIIRRKGGHMRMKHPDGRVVTVPVHPSRDIRGKGSRATWAIRSQGFPVEIGLGPALGSAWG